MSLKNASICLLLLFLVLILAYLNSILGFKVLLILSICIFVIVFFTIFSDLWILTRGRDFFGEKVPSGTFYYQESQLFFDKIKNTLATLQSNIDYRKSKLKDQYQFLDVVKEGFGVVDSVGNLVFLNQSFSELFKIDYKKAVGAPFVSLVDNKSVKKLVTQVRESRDLIEQSIQENIEVDGELMTFHVRAFSFYDNISKEKKVILVFHNVNEFVRMQKQMRDFVANVSHEFKTPLSILSLNNEILLNQELLARNEEMNQVLSKNKKHIRRLDRLIGRMLKLSRVDFLNTMKGSEANLNQNIFENHNLEDIKSLMQRTYMEFLDIQKYGEFEFDLTLSSKVDFNEHVLVNSDLLGEVFRNLIDNSLKYNQDKKLNIQVDLSVMGENIIVDYRDDGVGIEESKTGRVFDRFYRADLSHSSQTPGSGLGLSIVKSICDFHGFNIALKSSTGKGVNFVVKMPLKKVS